MTPEPLKSHGALYFSTIREGLMRYPNKTVRLSFSEARRKFQALLLKNGPDCSFTDFYYYSLDEDARQKIRTQLTQEEQAYLDAAMPRPDQLIFPLDQTLLTITARLNASGMLFSTLYFTKEKSTWWGNFNQEYIVFCEHPGQLPE